MRNSTVVTIRRRTTILAAAMKVLGRKRRPMSPSEIASIGLSKGIMRVPRGRNRGYLFQILQSTLYDNAHYSTRRSVKHKGWGQYKKA